MKEGNIKKRGWTKETALEALQENNDKNYTWFLANLNSLVLWCRTNGGWRKWADKVGIIPKRTKWSEQKVKEIFGKYDHKPMQWFYDNYSSMIQWCNNNGGIIYWKKRVNKKDIVRKSKRIFNDLTVTELLTKYKNAGKNAEKIGSLDSSLVIWCDRNGGWEAWIKKIGIEHRVFWNEEKVLDILKKHKDKNFDWFKFHYKTLANWCSSHGGWYVFAKKAGIQSNEIRTPESVVEFFKKHKNKDLMYFIKNHQNLVRWCYRNYEPPADGLRYYASLGGVNIEKAA